MFLTQKLQTREMDIVMIDDGMLSVLHARAASTERRRMNLDLRTTPNDGSQRMLNVLEPGTRVSVHRHPDTSESCMCLHGSLDVVIYDLRPNEDCGGPVMGECGTKISEGMESEIYEVCRIRLCPREGKYGVQIPQGVWHSVEVFESSAIFEAKDGAYKG